MKQSLNTFVAILFVLTALGQNASQWLIRSDVVLDFSQSPFKVVSVPDSISSKFSHRYFSHIESDMAGSLHSFILRYASSSTDSIIQLNSNFKRVSLSGMEKYQWFGHPSYNYRPIRLNSTTNKSIFLCEYTNSETGIYNHGLFNYSIISNSFIELMTFPKLFNPDALIYYNESQFYILGSLPNESFRINRIKSSVDGSTLEHDTIDIDSIGLRSWFISSNSSPIMATYFYHGALDDYKNIGTIQFSQFDSDGDLQLIKQFSIDRKEARLKIDGINSGCFSPNDSIFYFCHEKDGTKDGKSASSLGYINIYTGKTSKLVVLPDTNIVINSLATAPNGKIYFEYTNDLSWMPQTAIGVINYPDKEIEDIEVQLDFLVDNGKYDDLGPYLPNTIIGQNFLKIKCLQKNCTDSFIQCYNYTDTLYKSFIWDLMDLDSNVIAQSTGRNIKFHPPKTGTYLIRLTGKTRFGRNAYRWDKVFYRNPPRVSQNLSKDTLCQYSAKKFNAQFTSDSTIGSFINWNISTNSKTEIFNRNSINYTFADTGSYSIKLVYNNGYCIDSLDFDNFFKVVNAPKAGFEVSLDTICTSTEISIIDKSFGEITSATYDWNDGQTFYKRAGHKRSFTKPGNYKVIQTLNASNSCVSKDSMSIRVKKGLTQDSIPNLIVASVIDSTMVSLQWEEINNIQGYNLLRLTDQSEYYFLSSKLSYIDTVNAALSSISYQITAIDSCNMLSGTSNIAKTILLETKNYDNEFINLDWNQYEDWKNGVSEYLVQQSIDGKKWNSIAGLVSTKFQDNTTPLTGSDSIYYRIVATQNQFDSIQSFSNVVKVSLKSTAFIPNAFTPNNDGKNDTFKIGSFGIKDFYCIIFSNNGQVVGISNDPNSIWDGISSINEPYPSDTYFYIMTFTKPNGESIKVSGNLELIAD